MNEELMFRYITKQTTPEEDGKFEAWLDISESNRILFNDWTEIWKLSGKTYMDFEPDADKAWEGISSLITERTSKPKVISLISRNWYRIAASILIFVLLGIGGMELFRSRIPPDGRYLTYASGNDTLRIQLADGSSVSLNAHSVLKIPKSFRNKKRSVQLTGEAFFSITKDSKHSFKVYSNKTVTEVLGTSFNIKSQQSDVHVTLVTGKVALYNQGNPEYKLILNPGQHGLFINSTGLFIKDTLSNLNNISWKTQRLEFNQASMNDLCDLLSTHYKTKIVFKDTDNSTGGFTGIIKDISLDETISIVELTMGVEAIQYTDSVVFSLQRNKTGTLK